MPKYGYRAESFVTLTNWRWLSNATDKKALPGAPDQMLVPTTGLSTRHKVSLGPSVENPHRFMRRAQGQPAAVAGPPTRLLMSYTCARASRTFFLRATSPSVSNARSRLLSADPWAFDAALTTAALSA